MPFSDIELVSMVKAVMLEGASIKTFPILVALGTDEDANPMFTLLTIDPELQKEKTIICVHL